MKNIAKLFLIFCWVIISKNVVGQGSTDQQLAVHYYQNGEYDKARMYFVKLYEANSTGFYYQYLLKCDVELKLFKEAEKLIKSQQKKEPHNLTLHVDLAFVYELISETKKAEQEVEKAIKELAPDYNQITQLADALKNKSKYNEALNVYSKGEFLLGVYGNKFEINRAELYMLMGEYAKMIETYFNLLNENPSYLTLVQTTLSAYINFEIPNDPKVELLRTETLKRSQKDPSNESYSDMLVWYFQQRGDFASAFTQVKALDKRLKLDGQKLNEFATLCLNNDQYETAVKAYNYIVELGVDKPYYFISQTGLIDVLYRKIAVTNIYTPEELILFETNCKRVINEFNDGLETAELKIKLAHVTALFLHKNEIAIEMLQAVIGLPNLSEAVIAEAKLELADVLVMNGRIWDASIYYSQVEKAFKHDVIGHEAKFRNARIFYYSHDYKWAQSQLDVLKTSTSKLISNDALDLSLLITENLGLDSIAQPLNFYSEAELLFFQNKDFEALIKLDSLNTKYPWHSLADENLFLRYKIAKKNGNYDSAKKYLEDLLVKFPTDILGDNAVFALAELYQFYYKENDKAAEMYKKILFDYKGSLFQVEARKRFRVLRGENIN